MLNRRRHDLVEFLFELIGAYERGALGATTHEVHPPLARDSRENYLYFTLAPSINFQRPSEALWRAADRTYNDSETHFVFMPEETRRGRDAYLAAMAKHSLASFREKHTDIWYRIALTLAADYRNDPRVLLEACDYDVVSIRETLLRRRKDFPYLSGPKLANYWLYMLTCFTDAPLRRRDAITIIPDVHVIRASVRLGVVSEAVNDRSVVADAWSAVLRGTRIAPIDLHGPLWRWSRMGFPSITPQES
jgi:hypothetical protein